ncbi:MAG: phosphoribosyltransferase family protein [PVC group bacterium]
MPAYRNREEAGRVLASLLPPLEPETLVLAIPNGGVVVGASLTRELDLPLLPIVIRKIQLPGNTESGFGSVASDGSVHYNEDLLSRLGLSREQIAAQTGKALRSVEDRLKLYGAAREFPRLAGKTVVLTDDGLASGVTMESAVRVIRKHEPDTVIVAVPTASTGAYQRIAPLVDELVCPDVRGGWVFAVADAYEDWSDVTDEEVTSILSAPD